MKQMWLKMHAVNDEYTGKLIRRPDFGDCEPRVWAAVVGEPYGKHPDLPNFQKPLGDYMLVTVVHGDDVAALEAHHADEVVDWTLPQEGDVPDEILMITDLTLAGNDQLKAEAAVQRHASKINKSKAARDVAKQALLRMVVQGVLSEEAAVGVSRAHALDRDEVHELRE